MTSPIVFFGYSQLGFDALQYLINARENVALVVTHHHNPDEHIWFGDVAALAKDHDIPVMTPDRDALDTLIPVLKNIKPGLLLSFYYRYMLPEEILNIPSVGAFNMHGSLLPKYRGRAPVNWAILNGERETGATLHHMDVKPDAGYIVGQRAVMIGANDNAGIVTERINAAALGILSENLEALKTNTHNRTPMDIRQGSYCGGRTREDGLIRPDMTAQQVHDLVRALQPYPQYPAAFLRIEGVDILVHETKITDRTVGDVLPGTFKTEGEKEYLSASDYWLEIITKTFP